MRGEGVDAGAGVWAGVWVGVKARVIVDGHRS